MTLYEKFQECIDVLRVMQNQETSRIIISLITYQEVKRLSRIVLRVLRVSRLSIVSRI